MLVARTTLPEEVHTKYAQFELNNLQNPRFTVRRKDQEAAGYTTSHIMSVFSMDEHNTWR